METNTTTTTPSATQPPPTTEAAPAPSNTEEVIPRGEFEHVKKDMHKFKEEAKAAKDQLLKIETQALKDKEEWKKLSQLKEKEAADEKEKRESLEVKILTDRKMSVIRDEARKLGISDTSLEDLELKDWSDVQVEFTSTGRINVLGAAAAVAKLKTLRPTWFQGSKPPNVNTSSPGVTADPSSQVSTADIYKAEAEAKKTGKYEAYHALLMKYKAQQKK